MILAFSLLLQICAKIGKIKQKIKEDDNIRQICIRCTAKLEYTNDFYETCHETQKRFRFTTEKYDAENKENAVSLTSNPKRQIISPESPKRKIRLTNAESPITRESLKNQSHKNRCLREICPNVQSGTNSRTLDSQKDKENGPAQEATATNSESMVIVKQETDIENECLSNSNSALPPSSLDNSMVWIHSSDWSKREPDKPKSVTSITIDNSPSHGDEAESNKRTSFKFDTSAVPNNVGKSLPIVSDAPVGTCLPESNTISSKNNESTNSSESSTSGCIKERKCSRISELITNEQKQIIETCYTVDLDIRNKCAEDVRNNMTIRSKNNIKCNLCSAQYTRLDKCEVHIWAHLNVRPYKCKECSFSTVTLSNVRCHIRKSHLKIKPFACKLCPKRYATSALLKEHVNTHTGVRPYKCKTCGFSSTSRQALNNHMDTHASNEKIPCSICGKTFYSRIRIRAHMRIHNDNNVTCEICRARLSNPKALEAHHKKVHTHDYVCDICSKVLKSRKALHNHMNTHAEAKYKCTRCPNVYKSRHILNEHLLKHEGIRKYKCSICEKTFAQQSHLAAHNKVHSLPSYECPNCGRKYNRRDNMKTHMTRCKLHTKNCQTSTNRNQERSKTLE